MEVFRCLVAPYRAILRYYRCDTPYCAILFRGGITPPKWCDTPPWYLVLHRHICAIPHFATYRAIIVRYPIKLIETSTKEFCDTIATNIAQYEKYRCWASKFRCAPSSRLVLRGVQCRCLAPSSIRNALGTAGNSMISLI